MYARADLFLFVPEERNASVELAWKPGRVQSPGDAERDVQLKTGEFLLMFGLISFCLVIILL